MDKRNAADQEATLPWVEQPTSTSPSLEEEDISKLSWAYRLLCLFLLLLSYFLSQYDK